MSNDICRGRWGAIATAGEVAMSIRRGVRSGRRTVAGTVAAMLLLVWAGCGGGEPEPVVDPGRMTIKLTSPDFSEGGSIPREATCDGAGTSPRLEWSGVPEGARELALIVDDPDAPMGTFSHWVVIGLSAGVRGLAGAVPAVPVVPEASMLPAGSSRSEAGARQGKNDFGKVGYGGPCPPSGTHRYVFHLYALDAPPALPGDSPTRSEVLRAIKDHILAEGRLTGRYARSSK